MSVQVESFAIDQAELEEDQPLEGSKFLLAPEEPERSVDPETQARLEALLEAAGIGKLSSGDGKHLADHEVLRRLTSSVSCALDEAAAALTRMRSDNSRSQNEKRSLVEACTDGDVGTVRKLLTEGRSVHETTEEGESLLSLACSAGYYELAQVNTFFIYFVFNINTLHVCLRFLFSFWVFSLVIHFAMGCLEF